LDLQIRLLSMLGNGFNEERRFSEALSFFKRAIQASGTNPDAGFPFMAYGGAARALASLGNRQEAEQFLSRALWEAQHQSRRIDAAEILLLFGEIRAEAHDIGTAKNYFEQAAEITQELRFDRGIADTMFDLARAY